MVENPKDEWYTPEWITKPLGTFDLDPAAPMREHRRIARQEYTMEDNGLTKEWTGRVWLNPPFSHPALVEFVKKMAEHDNGIMLLLNRGFDSAWFQDYVFEKAKGMLIIRGRVKFDSPNGVSGSSPIGSSLIAYGKENEKALKESRLPGKYIVLCPTK